MKDSSSNLFVGGLKRDNNICKKNLKPLAICIFNLVTGPKEKRTMVNIVKCFDKYCVKATSTKLEEKPSEVVNAARVDPTALCLVQFHIWNAYSVRDVMKKLMICLSR